MKNITKKCSDCNILKSLEFFHKNKSSYDGYHYICKECRSIRNKNNSKNKSLYNKKYYENNKEEILEQSKKYWAENYDKDKEKIRKQKYYLNNKNYICRKSKKYKCDNYKMVLKLSHLYTEKIRMEKIEKLSIICEPSEDGKWIYLATDGEHLKIGISNDPTTRIKYINNGLTLIGIGKGTNKRSVDTESIIHYNLKELNIKKEYKNGIISREWFINDINKVKKVLLEHCINFIFFDKGESI